MVSSFARGSLLESEINLLLTFVKRAAAFRGDLSSNMVNFRLDGKPGGHLSAMLARTIAAGVDGTSMTPGELDLGEASRLVCRAGGQHMALRRTFRVTLVCPVAGCRCLCAADQRAEGRQCTAAAAPAPAADRDAAAAHRDLQLRRRRQDHHRNLGTRCTCSAPTAPARICRHRQPTKQPFGTAHDAIVIDGREALVMKGGKTPLPANAVHAATR